MRKLLLMGATVLSLAVMTGAAFAYDDDDDDEDAAEFAVRMANGGYRAIVEGMRNGEYVRPSSHQSAADDDDDDDNSADDDDDDDDSSN